MKTKFTSVVTLLISLLLLTSCSNEQYEDAMNKGIESLSKQDYHQAALYFEIALQEKKEDANASSYFEQATQLENAISAVEQNKLDDALKLVNMVIEDNGTLQTIKDDAQKLKEQILSQKELISSTGEMINTIRNLITDQSYTKAQEQLQLLQQKIQSDKILTSYATEVNTLVEQVNIALEKEEQAQEMVAKAAAEKTVEESIAYSSYTNERFGFSLEYPTNLTMAPPPTNGDGAIFYNEEFELTAYGAHTNVIQDGETIETYYQEDVSTISEEIAYQRLAEDWYVLSYQENGSIIYKKFFFGDGTYNTFTITYPASKQETYGPVTTHIAKTFIPGYSD